MNILGLSFFYHDAAACIVSEGVPVAAAQEERFTRLKHDWKFPENAIRSCLKHTGISMDDIDLVSFYEKPLIKFERVIETYISVAPRGFISFVETVPSWLRMKLRVPDIIRKKLGYSGKILFWEHHMSHAAGSFFLSPFSESAILTVDGVGEWASASFGSGREHRITLSHEMRFPNSLGLLYSAFTAYLGFEVNEAEYKVMGMAPYGKPRFCDLITRELVKIGEDGNISLNPAYFSFQYGKKMFNRRFEKLFGIPARKPESFIGQEHFDIAMSIQKVTEEAMLKMARHVHRQTGQKNLCLSGGVALNCVANAGLLAEGPFENIFIQPAAGDAGAAVGAAYLTHHHYLGRKERSTLRNLYLGPKFSNREITDFLILNRIPARELSENELLKETARLISAGKVIGWFQGAMEFGPRALGNRSILADPRRPEMKDIVNRKIKFRETFRPFAPAVPFEESQRYFDLAVESPYMLLTAQVKTDKIPAVTHIDGSARLQTVRKEDNRLFHSLLTEFGKLTGIPVLLNTSLNLRGEPIACSPEDAYGVFLRSGLDCLVLGNFLLLK